MYSVYAELIKSLIADFDDHIFCILGVYNFLNLVWYNMDECNYLVLVIVSFAVEETMYFIFE